MAIDIFARIGTIKGESRDDRHKDDIDVIHWTWGVSQTVIHSGTGSGAAAGRAAFADLTFVHHIDRASPALMKACATGEHIRDATISARKAGRNPNDYLTVKMTDVLITGVTPAIGRDEGTDSETVALRFGKVTLSYATQKPDGSLETPVEFVFDIDANRAG